MALTDLWLKANHKKPHDKQEVKADGQGLSVRVSPLGKIVFQMRFTMDGVACRLDLGAYPRMSLKEARAEHQRLKGEWEQGHDPRQVKRLERLENSGALTNEKLFRDWYAAYCLPTKQQADEILRSFEIHVFPKIGSLPADRTSANVWMNLIEGVVESAPSIGVRILHNAKQMHKWAGRRELINNRPLADFTTADLMIKTEESGRSLSDDEIRLFWHSIDRSRMVPRNKLFLKLCLFFGCRNGELRSANPKEDFDFETMLWTVPKEKNKTGRKTKKAIVRPIIPEVVPMLQDAIRQSLSPDLLITQDAEPLPLSSSATLSLPYNVRRAAKKLGEDMAHWSMHDLRKTARTNFSTLTSVHVAEVMLGHSLKGMQGVYDRHLYIEEQTAAYRAWWQRLHEIVSDMLGK